MSAGTGIRDPNRGLFWRLWHFTVLFLILWQIVLQKMSNSFLWNKLSRKLSLALLKISTGFSGVNATLLTSGYTRRHGPMAGALFGTLESHQCSLECNGAGFWKFDHAKLSLRKILRSLPTSTFSPCRSAHKEGSLSSYSGAYKKRWAFGPMLSTAVEMQ